MSPIFACLMQAVMFAIAHNGVGGMMYALIAGFILGTVAERSNGIAVPAAAHIAINLRTFLYSGVIPETLISTIDIFVITAGIISAAVLFILTKKLPTYEKTAVREETVREEAEFDD
jgi:membrane protease YdiL (CAAX protease family)